MDFLDLNMESYIFSEKSHNRSLTALSIKNPTVSLFQPVTSKASCLSRYRMKCSQSGCQFKHCQYQSILSTQTYSCYFPFICHTCEHINSFPQGKLCVARAAQQEIPPSQLVTDIFCCFLPSGFIN